MTEKRYRNPDKGAALTGQLRILSRVAILCMSLFLLSGCVPLEKMDKASGSIEETDYLNSFAGLYSATISAKAADEVIITLHLYPDGSCLLVEKTIGGASGAILVSTGRWDHSDFSEGITLHLKSKSGARRVMQCSQDEDKGRLHYAGQGYGPDGLTLIKR